VATTTPGGRHMIFNTGANQNSHSLLDSPVNFSTKAPASLPPLWL